MVAIDPQSLCLWGIRRTQIGMTTGQFEAVYGNTILVPDKNFWGVPTPVRGSYPKFLSFFCIKKYLSYIIILISP